MHLKTLRLCNFRSYKEAEFSFSPGINAIQGENGQGKTNLLEAISVIATGRSFRTSSLKELIRFGTSFFFVEAVFEKEGVENTLSLYYDGNEKRILLNQTKLPHFHALLGNLPLVISSPEDLSLLVGAPQERRKFLDLYLTQTDPLYLYHLGRYTQAMRQRNCLLKQRESTTMDAWERIMGNAAAYLILKRKKAISLLSPHLAETIGILSQKRDLLTLEYITKPRELGSHPQIEETLVAALQNMRTKEEEWGHTLVGPHRDDLSFALEEKVMKSFSSQGQKRSCLFALRFAQWIAMYHLLQEKPLLGIDDFGMQLDEQRKTLLQHHLNQFGQIFLTAPTFNEIGLDQIISIKKSM